MARDRRFNMHLSVDELRMLRELAHTSGLTASDYLRQVIRERHWAGNDAAAGNGTRVPLRPTPESGK